MTGRGDRYRMPTTPTPHTDAAGAVPYSRIRGAPPGHVDKVAGWTGCSRTHGFGVTFYRDTASGLFVAEIHTYSDPEWTEYVPGDLSMHKYDDDPEELTHTDLNALCVLAVQRIASRCGPIDDFDCT